MDVRTICRWPRALCFLTMMAIAGLLPAAASAETVYKNFPVPLEKNMPSVGFEATSTSEFGGEVGLPALTARRNPTITVGMSTWACQSGTWSDNACSSSAGAHFPESVTLNVYEAGAGNTVGAKLTSKTATFQMPYRPKANKHCTTGEAKGGYAPPTCFHGKLFKIKFKLAGFVLPTEKAIVSVAYNTSDYGYTPQGAQPCRSTVEGCPYDALNVAVTEGTTPTIGSYPLPDEVFEYSTWNEMYCGNSAAIGSFGPSGSGPSGMGPGGTCWVNEQPVFEIKAN